MQVKKFEAPSIQEALDSVKRELGPEAIILQTKKNRRGLGLSKASYEVTAAVSERAIHKKQTVESKLTDSNKKSLMKMPAEKQAEVLDRYGGRNLTHEKYNERRMEAAGETRDQVVLNSQPKQKITATRYIDIPDDETPRSEPPRASITPSVSTAAGDSTLRLEEEVRALKRVIEEMRQAQSQTQNQSQSLIQTQSQSPSSATSLPAPRSRMESSSSLGTGLGTGFLNASGGGQPISYQMALDVPALQDAFEQLVINGVDRRYAHLLVKKVVFELEGAYRIRSNEQVLDVLASQIMESLDVLSPLDGIEPRKPNEKGQPHLITLVGATGVGKTTALAKIASIALLKKRLKIGFINFHQHQLGAFEELATYAKILNVPFRSAGSIEDLKAALADLNSFDVIFMDTTGRSHKDTGSLLQMQSILDTLPNLTSYLVLSATTRDTELYEIAHRFSVLRPKGIVISKLDEASIFGSIYNISQRAKLPLTYFTTGQKIPDDIEEATRERVAALVMDI